MDLLKNLAYAGLGLLESTDTKIKEQFAELVKKGKEADERDMWISDFFNAAADLDTTTKTKYNESLETLERIIAKMKVKAKDEI
tara:strand:- start:95 stop:346 length:252 start_codon:yes stop_codon:yes gene_type:complete